MPETTKLIDDKANNYRIIMKEQPICEKETHDKTEALVEEVKTVVGSVQPMSTF